MGSFQYFGEILFEIQKVSFKII